MKQDFFMSDMKNTVDYLWTKKKSMFFLYFVSLSARREIYEVHKMNQGFYTKETFVKHPQICYSEFFR